MGTHLFNAMRPIHHREPGPIIALLEDPRVTVEMITDGVHLHPALYRHVIGSAVRTGSSLITDAMAATGMADGAYRLGPLAVDVVDGVARVAGTDTIAGSTATMDRVFRFAVAHSGLPRDEALLARGAPVVGQPGAGIGAARRRTGARCRRRPGGAGRRARRHRCAARRIVGWSTPPEHGVLAQTAGWPGQWTPMHTTPLLTERDTDLRRAIQAVDPEDVDHRPAGGGRAEPDPKRGLVLATVGGVVGLGALALLVALVLARPTTRPGLRSSARRWLPSRQTTTDRPSTTTPSAGHSVAQRLCGAPAPVACRHSAADRRRLGGENGAVRACPGPGSVRTRLRELFPRLFP